MARWATNQEEPDIIVLIGYPGRRFGLNPNLAVWTVDDDFLSHRALSAGNRLPLSRGHGTRKSSTYRDDDAVAVGGEMGSTRIPNMNVGQANMEDRKCENDREAPSFQAINGGSHCLIHFAHRHLLFGPPADMLGSRQTLPCGRFGNRVEPNSVRENAGAWFPLPPGDRPTHVRRVPPGSRRA